MRVTRNKKSLDAVELKRRVQTKIFEQIKDLTPEQEIAYFEQRAEHGPLGDWWRAVRRATADRESAQRAEAR